MPSFRMLKTSSESNRPKVSQPGVTEIGQKVMVLVHLIPIVEPQIIESLFGCMWVFPSWELSGAETQYIGNERANGSVTTETRREAAAG